MAAKSPRPAPATPATPARDTRDTRRRLHAAAVRSVVERGAEQTVRKVAGRAGVTGAALYRHYSGLEELYGAVFEELVGPMIAEKQNLVSMRAPVRDRLREWVRCTYACFDRNADAFAYVFLSDRPLPERLVPLAHRQSELLAELLAQGRAEGALRKVTGAVAVRLFVGLLLSIPAGIREAAVDGPASAHIDEVDRAIWLTLAKKSARTTELAGPLA